MDVARTQFTQGALDEAKAQLREGSTVRDLELLGTISYLQGSYDVAIAQLSQVIQKSRLNPLLRYRARRYLSLAYLQTNRFDRAASLPLRDPLTRLMRSFGGEPYRITWSDQQRAALPFLQHDRLQLPQIRIIANGTEQIAKIDTGGDLLSFPWSTARQMGIEPVSRSTGWFAGGKVARVGYGIVDELDIGGVTIQAVPVSINSFDHPIVGTGLLRQFLPTLDYPNGHLLLEPRQTGGADRGFPFLLAGAHLMIASGSVNGCDMPLLVDSGLEVSNEACFLAPVSTLTKTGIDVPETTRQVGTSGAGTTKLNIGEFVVSELRLGTATKQQAIGLTGVFPKQLTRPSAIGFPIGGLVSHNFLRVYRWTIDFDRMSMTLA